MNSQKMSDLLEEIACTMTTFSQEQMGSSADAGMTYIGQMVSHDIVPPTKKNSHSRIVTPYLNLDSIYGDSPSHYFKYAPEKTLFLDETGRFKISERNGVQDLARKQSRKGWEAIIPEPRNDENRIISQLHLFWQKVHNWIMDKGYADDALEAQMYTVILFQLVTVEEFCKSTFNSNVFEYFFRSGKSPLPLQDNYTVIPDFFSKASFRFGHSIVRKIYNLNSQNSEIKVGKLFGKHIRLVKKHEIDWCLFFSLGKAENEAMAIDTFIVDAMRSVPDSAVESKISTSDVILFNLQAGLSIHPFEGHNFVDELKKEKVVSQILESCGFTQLVRLDGATFKDVQGVTAKSIPLWPYILLEAKQKEVGIKLGPLGSFLNARVLYSAMNHSKYSAIHAKGYDFELALESLNEDLSEKLVATIDFFGGSNIENKYKVCPLMEALNFLVNK